MSLLKSVEAVQKGRSIRKFIIGTVMAESDPSSPAFIKDRRSRIERGMTPFMDSLTMGDEK